MSSRTIISKEVLTLHATEQPMIYWKRREKINTRRKTEATLLLRKVEITCKDKDKSQ